MLQQDKTYHLKVMIFVLVMYSQNLNLHYVTVPVHVVIHITIQ